MPLAAYWRLQTGITVERPDLEVHRRTEVASVGSSDKYRRLGLVIVVAGATSALGQGGGDDAEATAPTGVVVVEGQLFDHNGAGVLDVEVALFAAPYAKDAKPLAVGRTDHYGDFKLRLADPVSGSFVVVFNKAGHAEVRREVEIVAGELPPFVDLDLPGNLTLAGKIIDKLENAPVAGASVRVQVAGRSWSSKTDEAGVFKVEQLPPGPGSIEVQADGFGRESRRIESVADEGVINIDLRPERIVRIEIVDEQGVMIVGAVVDCYDASHDDFRSVMSDERGLAVVRGLHFDAATLVVRLTHERFVSDRDLSRELSLPVDAGESRHRLTMSAAGAVAGVITDAISKRPVNGVRVMVGTELTGEVLQDWTGFGGKYSIGGVTPGETAVTTYLNGYASDMKTVTVEAGGELVVDFVLGESKEAGGIVVDEDGKPIGGAYIHVTSWRGLSMLGVQTLSGVAGGFGLFSIPDDPFQVTVSAGGYQDLVDQEIQPGKMDHRFVLAKRSEPVAIEGGGVAGGLKVGEPFPAIELVTLEGTLIKPADLKGKTVLFDFWATWCGPCVAEIPNLVAVNEALGQRKDFVIISISLDSDRDEKKLRKFITEKKMNWVQVFGKKGGVQEAAAACGVQFIPSLFLVGPDGVLKSTDLYGPKMKDTISAFLDSNENDSGT